MACKENDQLRQPFEALLSKCEQSHGIGCDLQMVVGVLPHLSYRLACAQGCAKRHGMPPFFGFSIGDKPRRFVPGDDTNNSMLFRILR